MRLFPLLAILAVSISLFGAGCSLDTSSARRPTQAELRQPAPAPAPTEQPIIPKEAEKIPRPY